jgi:hypothetical protein
VEKPTALGNLAPAAPFGPVMAIASGFGQTKAVATF